MTAAASTVPPCAPPSIFASRRRGRPSTMSPLPTRSGRAKPIAPRAATSSSKSMWSRARRRPMTAAPSSSA